MRGARGCYGAGQGGAARPVPARWPPCLAEGFRWPPRSPAPRQPGRRCRRPAAGWALPGWAPGRGGPGGAAGAAAHRQGWGPARRRHEPPLLPLPPLTAKGACALRRLRPSSPRKGFPVERRETCAATARSAEFIPVIIESSLCAGTCALWFLLIYSVVHFIPEAARALAFHLKFTV